jgi:class 3 adenylate cyclase/tetratricopeptide (TPR) repeat protein
MDAREPSRDSERRQATVMFADISGFTAMSERMDPEDVTLVMNRCWAMLERIVIDHGGVVDKYIGDCIMAVFGVPHAIENAPKQAVNAAIDIRNRLEQFDQDERLPIPLHVHVGINSGLVIAGDVGGRVKRDFTVMGDTVNLAARLKDASATGQIYVGPDTYASTKNDFQYRPLKPLSVKGRTEPVVAYELLSARASIHRPKVGSSSRMIESAMVGRDRELAQLRHHIEETLGGAGGIVSLIGEAGIGKSRLIAEVEAFDELKGATVLEGRSLSIGQSLSFHPFTDLLRQWASIQEDDDEQQALRKLEAAIGALLPAAAGEVFPFIATLMGMRLGGAHAERIAGIEGEAMEKLIRKSARDLFRTLAASQPLVLIFEDLHWADLSSINLLESLLRLVEDTRVLFIHAFRPDYNDTGQRILRFARATFPTRHLEMHLQPLTDTECDVLIRRLLKVEDLPQPTRTLIAHKAEGNPFCIEEVVRSLIDEGAVEVKDGSLRITDKIHSVVIPGTIQEVIMARIDRLDERTRNLLQIASVIGRSFYHRIIVDILAEEPDTELAYLQERQLICEHGSRRTATVRRRAFEEELEYVFTHALVQETLYESILQKTRKHLHLSVARSIESVFASRLADFYGMLAYHYSRAESLEKAEEYLFKAGDEAARAAASSEALHFFREASRIYLLLHGDGGDPQKKALLEKNIGLALLNKGDLAESIPYFDKALEYLGEPVTRNALASSWRFVVDMAAVLYHVYVRPPQHATVKDLEHERDVCELFFHRGHAEVTSDPKRLFLQMPTGLRRFNRIDPRKIDQACAMYVGCAAIFAYSGISFAISRRMLGVAETLIRDGNVVDLFVYRSMRYVYHYFLGDWDQAHAIDDTLIEQDLRYGQVWDVNTYLNIDCDRLLRRGEFAAAGARRDKLGEISDAYGYAFAATTRDSITLLLLVEQRILDAALDVAERYYGALQDDAIKVFALATIAKIQVLRGEHAAAAAALTRAGDAVRRAAVVPSWHRSAYLLSRLLFDVTALEACAPGARRRALRRAAQRSAWRGLRLQAKVAKERTETYKLVGRLCWLLGKPDRALRWWARSIAEGERLGARPELARTCMEVGRRLREAEAPRRELNGMDGNAYLERARNLFVDMELGWDLRQLNAVAPPAARPIAPSSVA